MIRRYALVASALVLLLPAAARAQDEGFDAVPLVVPAERVDLSIPLREMPLARDLNFLPRGHMLADV